MLRPLGAGHRIALHHQHRLVAHRLLVAERQAERGEQHPHGELGRKVGDEVETVPAAQRLGGVARDLAHRLGQRLEIALHEGVLHQAAQPVVARWIGGAERGAGAVGQFRHQIALGRRIGLPVGAGRSDIGVARQDPHRGLLAPERRMLVAQRLVQWERVGIDRGRIGIEAEHGLFPLVQGAARVRCCWSELRQIMRV